MKVALGSDHIGYPLKNALLKTICKEGITVIDCGTNNTKRTDYPIYAKNVTNMVLEGKCDYGILICGSGIGMSISANKIHGIRAVACSEPYSAVASRNHNNSNILCMGSRVVGFDLALMIVKDFLGAKYEGGRHQVRLDLIEELEKQY